MYRFPYFATFSMCHNIGEIREKTLLKKKRRLSQKNIRNDGPITGTSLKDKFHFTRWETVSAEPVKLSMASLQILRRKTQKAGFKTFQCHGRNNFTKIKRWVYLMPMKLKKKLNSHGIG